MPTNFGDLEKYLPVGAYELVLPCLNEHPVKLRITRPRRTKLGDFRSQSRNGPHSISVNGDLNSYAFLITLVHELAHLYNWVEYGKKAKAHGEEWKQCYRDLLRPMIDHSCFPADLSPLLEAHLKKAPAASCTDPHLVKALHKYDTHLDRTYLEDLPSNSVFTLGGNKQFRKGEKLRKRFRCLCLNNKRQYLIDPLAEVSSSELQELPFRKFALDS